MASSSSGVIWSMISRAEILEGLRCVLAVCKGGSKQGDFPNQSWKGVNPVDLLTVFMILNWILGMEVDHPFWSCLTVYLTH